MVTKIGWLFNKYRQMKELISGIQIEIFIVPAIWYFLDKIPTRSLILTFFSLFYLLKFFSGDNWPSMSPTVNGSWHSINLVSRCLGNVMFRKACSVNYVVVHSIILIKDTTSDSYKSKSSKREVSTSAIKSGFIHVKPDKGKTSYTCVRLF